MTLPRPGRREEREPRPHDRSEGPPDRAGPVALDGEQHGEDDQRDRDDEVLHRRRCHLEALDRREDRDRRRDHPVAVEERRAEDPERDERGLGRATLEAHAALDERDEGHDPAFALVVGAHDEGHVLDRDDDRDRPEDERDHAVDARLGGPHGVVVGGEDRLQRVERAGPDVAEDHAEGADGERGHAGLGARASRGARRRWRWRLVQGIHGLAGRERRSVDLRHPS